MSTLEMMHASNSCWYETYLTNYQVLRPVLPQDRKSPSRDLGVENEGSERQRARERLLDHRDRHLGGIRRGAVNPGPGSRGRRVRLLLDGRRRAPLGEALRRRRRTAHLRHLLASRINGNKNKKHANTENQLEL